MIVETGELRRLIHVDNDSQSAKKARYDSTDFIRLYRGHYDAVFRYCVHRLFERTVAEDVTSEVFLKVVENIESFRGSEKQFCNWLYRIATNAVNNHLRKSIRRSSLLDAARERTTGQVDNCEESAEKLALLREAVLTLKPRYQTIITLHFFENLKLTEIAEVLGSRPGTVRSQLARALARLRTKLASGTSDPAGGLGHD